jgi:hypothetical protein
MKDTNAIEKALKQKISKELRDIVDSFTDDVKNISDKYGGNIFYDFKEYSTNEGAEFHVDGINKVNTILHRMLMNNHGEHMLKYKSKELLNKLELI